MKNKVYWQKQKFNWNKSIKERVAKSNFKQTRSRKQKGMPTKTYNLDILDSSKINLSSLLVREGISSKLKVSLLALLMLSLPMNDSNKNDDGPGQDF